MEFFATAARGTERALADELKELGFAHLRTRGGGVAFAGERQDGWRACLVSRIAQRIQLEVATFNAASADDLYRGAGQVPWEQWLTPDTSLAVSAYLRDCAANHSGFAALKAKDAIVDRLRQHYGRRPTINRSDADVQVFLYWHGERVILYLDLAGEPLFKRGWRSSTGEAPLKETLAAALLRLSGWDRQTPLLDPMCGSGTLAIEAAQWAANIAPGLGRKCFGFERWGDFSADDRETLRSLRGELRRVATGQFPKISASDCDPAVLEAARANARSAGVRISFRQADVRDLSTCTPAPFLISNPPYGVRLGAEDGETLQRQLAAAFCRLHGWRVCLFTGNLRLAKLIPPRPLFQYSLWNGDIECLFLGYQMP